MATRTRRTRRTKDENAPLFVRLEVKAENIDATAHTFEGLAATWDLDLGDDVIHPGAFKATLREWKSSGRVIPLLDQHQQWQSVRAAVGKLVDAKETKQGLWTKWEVIDSADGDEVLERLRKGIVKTLSIGYHPVKFDFEESDEARSGMIRNLREIGLQESSLVLFPMQPNAQINTDSVKGFVASMNEEQRAALRAMLDEPVQEIDEEEAPEGKQDSPPADEVGDDDGAPDMSALDVLLLRRLGWQPTKEMENV